MKKAIKTSLPLDFGISDFIEEIPSNPETLNTKVIPFVHRDQKTYMIRPEPSWESSEE